MKSCLDLIGTRYEDMDCWEVVRQFYLKEFNIELKRYYDIRPEGTTSTNKIITSCKGDFIEVPFSRKSLKIGDIFVINIMGVPSHIAVYIGEGKMMHTHKHSGCVIENVTKWEKLIVGTYRVEK